MENENSDDSPAAAAAACPSWVMLNRYSYRQFADAKTTTSSACHTSTGHLFCISFRLAPPPACSSFYSDWAGSDDIPRQSPQIVTAHDNCLLLDVTCPNPNKRYKTVVTDYFLYRASSATQPSALSLLPACFFPMALERGGDAGQVARPRRLTKKNTGILRRGSSEVTVVQLKVLDIQDRQQIRNKAELCVLDTVSLEWELNPEVLIVHGEATASKEEELMVWWETDIAVPIGDRFLCFVDYFRGFVLCDMMADVAAVELRYVPLPVEVSDLNPNFDGRPCTASFRNMAAAGAGAVRFVTIESRCCCGAVGKSTCQGGQFLFTVTMWTLSLVTEDELLTTAAWVKDSVLDCEELWAMPGYQNLPRRTLSYPVVSCDDPDVICFMLRNGCRYGSDREDEKVWMLEVNMRSKTLRSAVRYNNAEKQEEYQVAAKLQC